MGASLNARVDKIYFGAYEQKGRSLTKELADANLLNHKTEVTGGVLEEECAAVLSGFFIAMRQKQKAEKERKKAEAENLGEKDEEKPCPFA
jgi:tRNA(adenine34) deaminase